MARQVIGHIVDLLRHCILVSGFTNPDNCDVCGSVQKRERVAHGSARFPRILPADQNMIGSQ
jgi:hypothetical protein